MKQRQPTQLPVSIRGDCMALTDYKVKSEDFDNMDIASLSDRPSADGMSAQSLKERFDAGAKKVIMPKYNLLIELLNSTEGAANIGITPIDGLAGYVIQEALAALKLLLDDKQSIEQSNKDIAKKFDATEAQSLVKEVSFTEGSGIFTITKYDGSVQTIDTAIEKVALDVKLDGQQFVLTLADGTEQRVDLSAFITETEVKSSDTITLSIESGAIVARLAAGTVALSHLSEEVTAYIEAKEQAAADSVAAALVSEQNAKSSATSAEQSYQNAKNCQEQACLCATQAELSRQAAADSETNAASSEKNAATSAQEAKKAAEEAKIAAGGDYLERSVYDPQGKKQDIFKYVDDNKPFDFENWVYRTEYSYTTVKNADGSITKQLLAADGTVYAESVTTIADDGSIVEHMICENEGVNAVKTTVKDESGNITSTITEGVSE